MRKIGIAICDANILIDLAISDCALIAELVAHCGTVKVPDIVFREVYTLDNREAERLGLSIVDTPALLDRVPGLSLQDSACLYLVKKNGWACITNDKKLRRECLKAGGKAYWGLETILLLVKEKRITKKRAETAARSIRASNIEMDDGLLIEFLKKLVKL